MCKKFLEKLLATVLIFNLTFVNFAFVTQSYAASFAEMIFGTSSDTGSKNISFDAYFEVEGENGTSMVGDVNSKNLFINANLNVEKEGYLQNAKIEIVGANDEELNFDIREEISENSEVVQSIENEQDITNQAGDVQADEEQSQEPTVPSETSSNKTEVVKAGGNLNTLGETTQSGTPSNTVETNTASKNDVENETSSTPTVTVAPSTTDLVHQIGEVSNQTATNQTAEETNSVKNAVSGNVVENSVTENLAETQENENPANSQNDGTQSEEPENVEEQAEQSVQETEEPISEEPAVEEPKENETVEDLIKNQEYLENFENNTLLFSQIEKDSKIALKIPIEYRNEEYIKESKLSGECIVRFTGTYVNNEGEQTDVAKEVKLKLSWKDERKASLEEEKSKYITYEQGIIFQTVERIDTRAQENVKTLPIDETVLEIEAPIIKDQKPSKISVVANSTEGTNGQKIGEVKFGEDNWEYNEEENKLRITVKNEKQMVEINESKGEYLQEGEKKQEERIYNGSGIDEFLVTYTYGNVTVAENEQIQTSTKAVAKVTTLSAGDNKTSSVEKESTYTLEGTTGEIVSLHLDNNMKEISKAYAYVNYNNPGKYETEVQEEMIVNISYKDIVEGIEVKDVSNAYVDKEGKEKETNDIYYKKLSVNKENFQNILGESGEIRIKDEAGNLIGIINKDTGANEDGNVEAVFAQKCSKLTFEITKPVEEGNIVISKVKAIGDVSVDKSTYRNLAKITSKSKIEAKYSYVEGTVNVGEVTTNINLVDTTTEATLKVNKDSLSTMETNTDIELRVKLNNAKESSDLYGHSEFEIELPEPIENVELTNTKLLYGEGLQITESKVEGRIIKVTIDGTQKGINTGVLTDGTNIVMNANIKVNMYTPAKQEKIILRYTNGEATNYVDAGVKKVDIGFSAPTGLVAVNSISNYDSQGSVLTSIRQGKKDGKIAIYGGPVTAKTELIVMNNYVDSLEDISILGRIPFEGVKGLNDDNDLGTTLSTKLAGLIEANTQNRGSFNIYYSENGEATKDLNDASNGWILEPANIETVKSYLIVPTEATYKMEKYEVLRFSYNYIVPENLPHNEDIYGTFGVYYKNTSETLQERLEIADLVGLTTGVGPELKVEVSKDIQTIKQGEEFPVSISVSNVGKTTVESVNIEFPIPITSTYSRHELDLEDATVSKDTERIKVFLDKMEIGQTVNLKIYLVAKILGGGNEDRDKITPQVNVTAADLERVIVEKGDTILIEIPEISITEEDSSIKSEIAVKRAGDEFDLRTTVINLDKERSNNVVVRKTLPKELTFVSATENGVYDENTRTITWQLGNMETGDMKKLETSLTVNTYEEEVGTKEISNVSSVKADNTSEYKSNDVVLKIGKPILKINQTTENENAYLKEGDPVNYTFTIRNDGGVSARNLKITDDIPDGIVITNINYFSGDNEVNQSGPFDNGINLDIEIPAESDLVLKLSGTVTAVKNTAETPATNFAVISSDEVENITSNSVTHILEGSSETSNITQDGESFDSNLNGNLSQPEEPVKTYKIEGIAWEDQNRDGTRNEEEEVMPDVPVKLVNSETGEVLQSITTNSEGAYSFIGVPNGIYTVLFEYDSTKYRVTTYQKEGVPGNINSDVISTTIESDGKTSEAGVTDSITINDGSISNIDLGLVLAQVFDLKLEKYISKVSVKTEKDETSKDYDNVTLAKTDIRSKYLNGAVVTVEYTFIVSNEGDFSGFAKTIVDYIPKEMEFNPELEQNKDWYVGQDGNLYTNLLENRELKSGDKETIKLILTKHTTEENIGIMSNIAEIYEDYNTYGEKDINSTPANKMQTENDIGKADLVIGVGTGGLIIYISIIVLIIILGSIAVITIKNNFVITKEEGGLKWKRSIK